MRRASTTHGFKDLDQKVVILGGSVNFVKQGLAGSRLLEIDLALSLFLGCQEVKKLLATNSCHHTHGVKRAENP